MLLTKVQKEHWRLEHLEQQGETIQLPEKRFAALEAVQPSAKLKARLKKK